MEDNKDLFITPDEHREFLKETSFAGRMKILLRHSKKNNLRIKRRNIMTPEVKTQEQIEKEMLELNNQFSEFLHTKGFKAKFKLAFSNMKESAKKQKEKDKAQLEAVKAKSAEDNKEFVEFLHTKGFKAKCRLVIDNIKKGAAEAPKRTAANIAKVKAETQANIAKSTGKKVVANPSNLTAEDLSREFNEFLKSKGLDNEYTVVVENNID